MNVVRYGLLRLLEAITSLGSPFLYIILIAYIATVDIKLALKLVAPLAVNEALCAVMKVTYYTPRPKPRKHDTLLERYDASSFPSIHSARIILLGIMFSYLYKTRLAIFINAFIVLMVGYSRVHLKEHYIVDVIGGYAIGSLIAAASILYLLP